MGKRLWPWMLVVLALCVSLLIQVPSSATPASGTSQEFTMAITANPNTLDPALATTSADLAITQNVFQTLLEVSSTGQLIPDLAQTVTVSGHTINLVLRSAKTTNGKTVSAAMVAEALARPLWPSVDSAPARTLLSSVVGYPAVISGQARYLSGITVTGPRTLQIRLTAGGNISTMLRALANPVLSIVPISDQAQGQANWQYTNLFGTTVWTLKQWTPGLGLVFRRLGGGRGPAEINVAEYPSSQQAILSVVNGVLDAAPITPTQIAGLRKRWKRDLYFIPSAGTLSLYFQFGDGRNSAYPKISISKWVHRALSQAVHVRSQQWPTSLYDNRPMTVWVDGSDSMAVQLANTLAQMEPLVRVRVTSASELRSLASRNVITAYIGTQSWFSNPLALSLTASGSFWMKSPIVKAMAVFPDGAINWSSVRIRG